MHIKEEECFDGDTFKFMKKKNYEYVLMSENSIKQNPHQVLYAYTCDGQTDMIS